MANINHIRRGETLNRSVRMSKETWDKVKDRAAKDGVAVNTVIEIFATAYAQEDIDLPELTLKFD